jgi:hypothetical protein
MNALSKEEWAAIRREVDLIDRLRSEAVKSPPQAPAAQERTAASSQLSLPL